MDRVPATLEILPDIADAVRDSVEVLFDSGIRRGADIVTAAVVWHRDAEVGGRQLNSHRARSGGPFRRW
jgi:FMN-dependent dehydrogenase